MYVGTGARLLLVVVFAVFAVFAVAENNFEADEEDFKRLPRSKLTTVFQPNMNSVQLLKHVMKHEKQWTDVLRERIKILGYPPYVDYKFNAPPVVPLPADGAAKSDATMYDVREIVATVATHYTTIRSIVEYGANALRRALSCFTFRHLLFQAHCVSMMMIKGAKPITVLTAAIRLKENAGAFINVLTAVPNPDLSDVVVLYWEAVNITQYDTVQHVQGHVYPPESLVVLRSLRNVIKDYLDAWCQPFVTDEDFFQRTGVQKKNPMISDPSLLPLVNTEQLWTMSRDHAKYLANVANGLGIVTVPHRLWSHLFYYSGQSLPYTNKMDATNPAVTEDLTYDD